MKDLHLPIPFSSEIQALADDTVSTDGSVSCVRPDSGCESLSHQSSTLCVGVYPQLSQLESERHNRCRAVKGDNPTDYDETGDPANRGPALGQHSALSLFGPRSLTLRNPSGSVGSGCECDHREG